MASQALAAPTAFPALGAHAAHPAVQPAPSLTPTVLIVDCDHDSVTHCARMLDDLNYPHIGVTSAREALDFVVRDPSIEIVAASTHMPMGDGFVLIEEARTRIGPARPLAFIATTEEVTAELAVRGLHAEAVDLLGKPMAFEDWSLALRRANRYLGARRASAQDATISGFGHQLGELMTMLKTVPARRPQEGHVSEEDIAATLAAIIAARSLRTRYFPGQIFADPAWDILLDLARAKLEGEQVSVSSVCIAASVPMSTALRWVKQMTDANLLHRWTDPNDRRRDLIALTEPTADRMREYLALAHKRFSTL
jgi:CheY-like chemotaxis protein